MIETVSEFLEKYSIKNQKVLVGFSAGPDSCALGFILSELKKKFNLEVVLCYFNHGWRKEALEEESFTKDFAKKYDFEFSIGKMPKNVPMTEEMARVERYKFFEKTLKEHNSSCVLLAHNKNDNVETIVYRLIKGTSIKGLRAIVPKRDFYYRPMLDIEKDEILKFLKQNNLSYMVDSSNEETKYKRNYIRKEILPLFKNINPNYVNSINLFSKTCSFAQKIIDDKISQIENDIISDDIIQKPKYIELDIAYRLEILNNFLGDKLKYRDFKTLKKLDDFILNNITSKTSLNSSEFLKVRKDKIYIGKRNGFEY